eukprot:TRINITY_DN8091_c0_g1_i1.p1 TRINITY_DN8091_c0_g1~~TRINITY_DN8091_c0_g1_i1.p1  ORF type:complete len:453 (+),score=42.40 TRINITY_DN8091_c0_g1_i1:392-1750(+)
MGSRIPSHKLSNGLYVSGRREQNQEKTRQPTMTSKAMPYTGGDIKKSGELGKMFDIPVVDGTKVRPSSGPQRSGSFGGSSNSGPQRSNSGPLGTGRKTSGPLSGGGTPLVRTSSGQQTPVLPATGLITSGPISKTSGPLSKPPSGPQDGKPFLSSAASSNAINLQAVTNLGSDQAWHCMFGKAIPRVIPWTVIPLFLVGFIAGGFILGAVHNPILLIVVGALFAAVGVLVLWNCWWGDRAVTAFLSSYSDSELRTAKNGQYVKVTGVVTCGSVPLESSYTKIPRCVYVSTALYEYRKWNSKPANPKHRRLTWGLRYVESHVVDFYISDFQSGLRALVKAGYNSKVTPYVDTTANLEASEENMEMSPEFVRWLGERNLSSDDRIMRIKEEYVKEGSTVSVMGVVQRNDNVLMIVPPPEPVSTGCQWGKLLLPASLEGIILHCEDSSKDDVIPV